jgi:hypothetical protein
MAHGLLIALSTMCAPGCLWPTSLTDAVSTGDNVRPVFTRGVPPFGDIASTAGDFIALEMYAEDPNPDVGDVLHVRQFKLAVGDTTRVYQNETVLTHVSGGESNDLYHGTFPFADLCGSYHDGAEIFVVVADAAFKPVESGMPDQSAGLTSENHWQLKCQ